MNLSTLTTGRQIIVLALIVFSALIAGCGGNNRPTVDPVHDALLLRNQGIEMADGTRNYHLYLPENPQNANIVLLLHGNSGSSDQLLGIDGRVAPFKLWLDIALRENLILLIPDGRRGSNLVQGWNDCRTDARTNPDADDVSFLTELISYVQSNHSNNNSKVFVAGISNGGLMTMRLANEVPELLTAIAIIVAQRPVSSECPEPDSALPVLIMNGSSDPILPYDGGQINGNRGNLYSAAETIDYWVARNQTDTTPSVFVFDDITPTDESTATRFTYANGTNQSVVILYEIANGGHTEPSIAERYGNLYKLIVGNQNADIEMSNEVWEFFSAY